MIVLYYGSGARDFEIVGSSMSAEDWAPLKSAAVGLLRARDLRRAAELLLTTPFEIHQGTNGFGDDFSVLLASVPMERYVELAKLENDQVGRASVRSIAEVVTELGPYVRFAAVGLDSKAAPDLVSAPSLRINVAAVERALQDAQGLLQISGPVSAVDRVHTALHGYVRVLCDEASLVYPSDAGLADLFKRLREGHPAFTDGIHAEHVNRMLRALATIVDASGTLRNRASVAHPNEHLMEAPEAILVVNCARSILHYLDARIRRGN